MRIRYESRYGTVVRRVALVGSAIAIVFTWGLGDPGWAGTTACTHCDAAVPDTALFCTTCGRATTAHEGIYCWRCGLSLPVTAQFCSRCGSVAYSQTHAHRDRATSTQMPVVVDTLPSDPRLYVAPRIVVEERPSVAAVTVLQPKDHATTSAHGGAKDDPLARGSSGVEADTATQTRSSTQSTSTSKQNDDGRGDALINTPISLRGRGIRLPPRLFDSPTGDILPSLGIHAGGGLGFGFSDAHERTERWVVSFGLGGAGEAVIASSNIVHVAAPESQPLLGFRLGLPVAWAGTAPKERLKMALNVASTGDNTFTSDPFVSDGGTPVNRLTYTHRETTVGVSGTWKMDRLRLHGILHWTDLRFEDIEFASANGLRKGIDEKDVHTSLGVGIDVRANPKTYFLAELRTAPQVNFVAERGEIVVASQTEFTMGLRFFLDQLAALDANVNIDDEAVGLADMEIGFGLHLMLEPRRVH